MLLTRSRSAVRPTLFFPTEEDSKAVEAIERLQDPKVGSPQPIWVFCREDKRPLYEALPGVKEVRTYAPGWTRENLKAVLALARSRVEVVSLDLLSPACFPAAETAICAPAGETSTGLQPGGSQLLLSEGPSRSSRPTVGLGNVAPRAAHKKPECRPPTLFFPTEEDSKAVEAIERLQDPKVGSPQPIWVFCREDKRPLYEALPGVKEVRTYAPGWTRENLKAVLTLARSRVEVVSSIFSPQPAFRLQKLLFVLLPARHRLAFNQEDLNCYYLKGPSRSSRPTVGLGNVAPRAAHKKPECRPPHVVFSHGGRLQSRRGNRKAAGSQGWR